MKKTLFAIAALAAMTSCSQEMNNIVPQQPKGQTVTIETNLEETKAAIGKNGFSVIWRDYDEISVLVKEGNGNFTENTLFERIPKYKEDGKTPDTDGNGKIIRDKDKPYTFIGTFTTPLAEEANIWYLLHPYSADIASIGNDTHNPPRTIYKTDTGEYAMIIENAPQDNSNTKNRMGHLNLPMYGIGKGNGKNPSTIHMHHFCSVIEVTVNNNLDNEIDINTITIDTKNLSKKITGDFRVKCNPEITENSITTPASMTLLANSGANTFSQLKVTKGVLAAGASAKFYLLARDFSLKAGEALTITVEARNNQLVKYEYVTVVKTMQQDMKFEAGKIYRTTVDYENQVNRRIFDNTTTNKLDFKIMKSVPTWMDVKSTATPATTPVLSFHHEKGLIISPNTDIVIELKQPINYLEATKTNKGGLLDVSARNENGKFKDFEINFLTTDKNEITTKTKEATPEINAKFIKISTAKKQVSLSEIVFVKPTETTPDPNPAQ